MNKSRTSRARWLAQWGLAILLVPASMATILLFTATGKPIPRTFRSWDDLGCRPWWLLGMEHFDDPTPRFVFGDIGSCFAKVTPHVGKRDEGKVDMTIHDFSSGAMLCALDDRVFTLKFCVSPDRRFLSLREGTTIQFFDLTSGKAVHCPLDEADDQIYCPVFAPDSQSALLVTPSKIRLINSNTRATIKVIRRVEEAVCKCFFDQNGRPKFYLIKQSEEQWDVLSEQCDWRRAFHANRFGEPESWDTTVFFTLDPDDSAMNCWSFADGRWLARLSIAEQECDELSLSPDGRFMIYAYSRPHWFWSTLDWIPGTASLNVKDWLAPSEGWNVCDTRAGSTWPGLPASGGIRKFHGQARFADQGSGLITVDDQGIYEWDLPPSWQYFTPWAWVALGAWLSLIGIWWRLRKRGRGRCQFEPHPSKPGE